MNTHLVAYVGCYGGNGIHVLEVAADGTSLTPVSRTEQPGEAGFLCYSPALGVLYAVDERKTDGRGPVGPAAAVHAFTVDSADGSLSWLNSRTAPGPFPCYASVDETRRALVTANHGSFEHIERVVPDPDGGWTVEYVYDDSTVLLYNLGDDGVIGELRQVRVLTGHGVDPNSSPQAGRHAQASAHAHCAVLDPSGRYIAVCDKATEEITVLSADDLGTVSVLRFPDETGPRHLVFDPDSNRAYVTCEFSSEVAALTFVDGRFELLTRQTTVADDHKGHNEPADVRLHPNGRFVYVNNRGEDSVAWFDTGLTRLGHVPLHRSEHPGVATRSFAFDPTGSFLLVADRPAGLVRSYAVDGDTGSLRPLTDVAVPEPAFVTFAHLGSPA